MHDYPSQSTNPARDLYKMWYALVEYHAPYQLKPNDSRYTQTPFIFKSGHSLLVDRDSLVEGKKPALRNDIMKIWPNGHFSVSSFAAANSWCTPLLRAFEELTFLRWGYVNREKALWVQDTPRRGADYATNREYPVADNWERRVPYIPLTRDNLFMSKVIYRLKFTTAWTIVAVGVENPGAYLPSVRRKIIKAAQAILDERYAIANKRYDWWQRRHELAQIRAGQAEKPRKAIAALDRVNIERMLTQNMTVYEPKVGPGGTSLPRQLALPMTKEVANVGC